MDPKMDFERWLEKVDPQGHTEVQNLYEAIITEESTGIFNCSFAANGSLIIKADHVEEILMIVSPSAKKKLISIIKEQYHDDLEE